MFTRLAITPAKVNRFGWNLKHSEYIVGGWPWQILDAFHAVATVCKAGEIFVCPLNNARFHWFQSHLVLVMMKISETNRDIHSDHHTGCQPVSVASASASVTTSFPHQIPFLLQPSQSILALDRHRVMLYCIACCLVQLQKLHTINGKNWPVYKQV